MLPLHDIFDLYRSNKSTLEKQNEKCIMNRRPLQGLEDYDDSRMLHRLLCVALINGQRKSAKKLLSLLRYVAHVDVLLADKNQMIKIYRRADENYIAIDDVECIMSLPEISILRILNSSMRDRYAPTLLNIDYEMLEVSVSAGYNEVISFLPQDIQDNITSKTPHEGEDENIERTRQLYNGEYKDSGWLIATDCIRDLWADYVEWAKKLFNKKIERIATLNDFKDIVAALHLVDVIPEENIRTILEYMAELKRLKQLLLKLGVGRNPIYLNANGNFKTAYWCDGEHDLEAEYRDAISLLQQMCIKINAVSLYNEYAYVLGSE